MYVARKAYPFYEHARPAAAHTLLFYAVQCGRVQTVAALLSRGAAPDQRQLAPPHRGWTALTAAAELGHLDMMQLLLERGAVADDGSGAAGGATSVPMHLVPVF